MGAANGGEVWQGNPRTAMPPQGARGIAVLRRFYTARFLKRCFPRSAASFSAAAGNGRKPAAVS